MAFLVFLITLAITSFLPTTNAFFYFSDGANATCHTPMPNDHVYFKDPATPNMTLFVDPSRFLNDTLSAKIGPALEKAGYVIVGHAHFDNNTALVGKMTKEEAYAIQYTIQRTAEDAQCGWTPVRYIEFDIYYDTSDPLAFVGYRMDNGTRSRVPGDRKGGPSKKVLDRIQHVVQESVTEKSDGRAPAIVGGIFLGIFVLLALWVCVKNCCGPDPDFPEDVEMDDFGKRNAVRREDDSMSGTTL